MGFRIIGAKAAGNNLARYASALQRETVSILKQEARGLAIELGAATLPGPGFNETNAAKFRATVDKDVRKVFSSKQDAVGIYKLMIKHAPHLAGAYWKAHKSNKPRAAAEIMRKAKLPVGVDPADLKKARIGKKGRVPGRKNPVSLAAEAQVRAFSRKQQARVGMAKAGWLCAAKGLGGRIRRNLVSATGARNTAEIFPKYVRDIARKFPDLGGAKVSGGNIAPRVEIWTSVNHAGAAMPDGLYLSAVSNAQDRIKSELENSMKVLSKRGSKRAA